MSLELRTLALALAAFTVAGVTVALFVPALVARRSEDRAAVRARRLARLRLLPARVATCAGLLVGIAFATFEPRKTGEYMGWLIPSLAMFGGVIVGTAAWRGIRIARATRRLTREWLEAAEPIPLEGIEIPAFAVTSPFPIVAVIGLLKPKLVIARSVLDACTGDELHAILAHEQSHLDRRDNVRRLMMSAAPDVLAWLPASDRHLAAWRESVEEAADDDASRAGTERRICLAAALLKVARLASGPRAIDVMPASAFYSGDHLDSRVRRLLAPSAVAGFATAPLRATRGLVIVTGLVVAAILALRSLYDLVETLIHRLP